MPLKDCMQPRGRDQATYAMNEPHLCAKATQYPARAKAHSVKKHLHWVCAVWRTQTVLWLTLAVQGTTGRHKRASTTKREAKHLGSARHR